MDLSVPAVPPWALGVACLGLVVVGIVAQKAQDRPHRIIVTIASLAFIAYLDAVSTLLLIAFAHIAFVVMNSPSTRVLRGAAWGGVLALMGYKLSQTLQASCGAPDFFVLIGVSYYTFRISSCLFDLSRNVIAKPDYLTFINYCFFFPIFAGGPVQRYRNFERNQDSIDYNIVLGLLRIAKGLIKKLLITDIVLVFLIAWLDAQIQGADTFSVVVDRPAMIDFGNKNYISASLAVPLFGFLNIVRAYFDISAFTDLALGASRLFGYNIDENFNRPFAARNIIDFWRRWHLTIVGWAKDYVFSPLMLASMNLPLSVALTMVAMGLWHEISWRWLFWGICHGTAMVVCGWWQRTAMARGLGKLEVRMIGKATTSPGRQIGIIEPGVANPGWHNPGSIRYGGRRLGTLLRSRAMALHSQAVRALFFVPAWLLNFGFMSLVFVAVSKPSLSKAAEFYSIMLGLK